MKQHWNQKPQKVRLENGQLGEAHNPHVGNVNIGKGEVKWYNLFK
jgi:hypothetical protein